MIKFTLNQTKALQTLLWILNEKPGISVYNVMKVMFSAECYHLNNYGRPIYGESYNAMVYGTVPQFMYDLTKIDKDMPFYKLAANDMYSKSKPDMSFFSESDIEALKYGVAEYGDLTFDEVRDKNHQHPAWKNHENELLTKKVVAIDYAEMIENSEILAELTELGELTKNMVF